MVLRTKKSLSDDCIAKILVCVFFLSQIPREKKTRKSPPTYLFQQTTVTIICYYQQKKNYAPLVECDSLRYFQLQLRVLFFNIYKKNYSPMRPSTSSKVVLFFTTVLYFSPDKICEPLHILLRGLNMIKTQVYKQN